MLLGLAYLFIAALASGMAYTGYFDQDSGKEPKEDALQPRPPAPRPPSRDADAPGLHTRPDGTRYLVMPLPSDIADRFRDRANAVHTAPAMGGAAL